MPKRIPDHTDLQILNILQRNAGISNLDLSKRIGLSPATTLQRVKYLHELQLLPVSGYRLSKHLLGYSHVLLLKIVLPDNPRYKRHFEKILRVDTRVESVFRLKSTQMHGSLLYRICIHFKEENDLALWIERIQQVHLVPIMVETETVEELIAVSTPLKLTYNDLPALRDLQQQHVDDHKIKGK